MGTRAEAGGGALSGFGGNWGGGESGVISVTSLLMLGITPSCYDTASGSASS